MSGWRAGIARIAAAGGDCGAGIAEGAWAVGRREAGAVYSRVLIVSRDFDFLDFKS